jgi:hypothetical protein
MMPAQKRAFSLSEKSCPAFRMIWKLNSFYCFQKTELFVCDVSAEEMFGQLCQSA